LEDQEIEAFALQEALNERGIEFAPGFPATRVTEKEVWAADGQRMGYDLLMLILPIQGPVETRHIGITERFWTRLHALRPVGQAEE
jgi:hypothetical protein